jgi:hypothetical protein
MADVRTLLQRAGAGLAVGAAAVLSGLGYTQVHQLFPLPPISKLGSLVLIAVAVASALVAVLGAAAVSSILLQAQRRILMSSRAEDCDFKGRREKWLIESVYLPAAAGEGAVELADLDLRAERLHRCAARMPSDDPARQRVEDEASRLDSVVVLAVRQAASKILEWRAARAFRGPYTAIAVVAAALGIIGLFASADYSKGVRDQVDIAVKCQKASLTTMPTWCKTVTATNTEEAWSEYFENHWLGTRLSRAQASARHLAHELATHPRVARVRYPGNGTIISFETTGTADDAEAVCEACQLIVHATSLGGVETSLERRARYPSEREVDTPPTLIRLSIGLEHPDDLWRDLERALA